MPFSATKTLQGVQRLDVSGGTYLFELPANPFPFAPGSGTNALELKAIEEVFIICEADVFIQLPSIANFNGGWNPKIYIYNVSGGASTIYSDPESNDINGGASVELNNDVSAYIRIASDLNWACFTS